MRGNVSSTFLCVLLLHKSLHCYICIWEGRTMVKLTYIEEQLGVGKSGQSMKLYSMIYIDFQWRKRGVCLQLVELYLHRKVFLWNKHFIYLSVVFHQKSIQSNITHVINNIWFPGADKCFSLNALVNRTQELCQFIVLTKKRGP